MVEDTVDLLVAKREKESVDVLSKGVAVFEEAVMETVEMMEAFVDMTETKRSLTAVARNVSAFVGKTSITIAPDRPIKRGQVVF